MQPVLYVANVEEGAAATGNASQVLAPNALMYPGATSKPDTRQSAGNSTVVLQSTDSFEKVTTYYHEQLKKSGWTVSDGFNIDRMATISGSKDGQMANITVTWNPPSSTTITLSMKR